VTRGIVPAPVRRRGRAPHAIGDGTSPGRAGEATGRQPQTVATSGVLKLG
jgi:hypothetical protein